MRGAHLTGWFSEGCSRRICFESLDDKMLRILEIKTATLLYCREAIFGARPIRQTTPFLPISDGQKAPLHGGEI